MSDLWQEMADQEVVAPPSGGSDIPDKLRFIVENTTEGAGDKMRPTIRSFGADEKQFYALSAPVVIVGGDAKNSRFKGRYIFMKFNTNKPTKERIQQWIDKARGEKRDTARLEAQLETYDKTPLNGELYNFILDTLAPEKAAVQDRWRNAFAQIRAMADQKGYTLAAFENDVQLMAATAFKDILLGTKYRVLGQTYTPRDKGDGYTPQQTLGSIEACTEDTMGKRKVVAYEEEEF